MNLSQGPSECVIICWKDNIDSWHATCSVHKWISSDGNFNRGEVEYIADVHRKFSERHMNRAAPDKPEGTDDA